MSLALSETCCIEAHLIPTQDVEREKWPSFFDPSIHPSIHPFIHPSIHPSVHSSVCNAFLSAPYLLNTLKDGQLFTSVRWCAEPMTCFPVRAMSPEPFERFSFYFDQLFTSVRWCAEPMTKLCRLKVQNLNCLQPNSCLKHCFSFCLIAIELAFCSSDVACWLLLNYSDIKSQY